MAASPLAAALLGGNAGGANPFAYLDPQIAQATPNLQLGQELLQSGLSGAPAYPAQAVARLAQVLAGRSLQQNAISSLTQAYAHTADNLANIFPAGTPMGDMARSDDPTVRMMAVQQAGKAALLGQQGYNIKPGDQRQVNGVPVGTNAGPQSPEGRLQLDVERAKARQAISGIESGGNYGQIGPQTKGGDHAYGKYQVMGANIPQWTQEVLGKPMTPQQFLNSPQAQDAVFDAKFGQYAQKYGPDGAARAWFAGEGGMNNPNARDQLGTSVQGYANKFDQAYGGGAQKAPATSVPSNPLQGAIDTEAAKAGASKAAEANVEFGDLLKPQAAPAQGPGGTEPMPSGHGTTLPPLSDQGQLPKTPAEAKPAVETWRKTIDGWNGSLQAGYQAEQRLNTIAQTFKTMQTGYGAEQKAQVASLLKSIGVNLPDSILGDPAKVETAIHENYVETLQQLKATTPRFTQMEFRALSENKEHPNLQPAANLQMLSEDIGQLRQSRDLPRDWVAAQQHGWRDPQSFEQAWSRQNPLSGYVSQVKKEIGPLKGMQGNEAGAKSEFPGGAPQTPQAQRVSSKAEYDALAKGKQYMAPDGTIRTKQ